MDFKGSVQKRKLRKGSRGYQGEKRGDDNGEVMEPIWLHMGGNYGTEEVYEDRDVSTPGASSNAHQGSIELPKGPMTRA
ncbi:hypothetical protein PVK06_002005 [Gossypium arboreum]|uniref:Uncharacterized protein n=1 Tax=Gossypium arboreum TaxID=29729 RepID=A0ABR0R3U9_GOSAR|nr:hypothetical protein PVK06_002005 [Gossypium arboreum]